LANIWHYNFGLIDNFLMENDALVSLIDRLRNQPHEVATAEFKRNWDLPRDIGQYISAMANSAVLEKHERAWMVWGVQNKTHAVVGTIFDPFSAKGEGNHPLIMWLTQKISPRPDFNFHVAQHPEGRVVVLEIHPPRVAPLAFSGERYIRVDSHTTKLDQHPDKEARLWAVLGGKSDWSGEIVAEASLDDLDPVAVGAARGRFLEYLLKSESDIQRHDQIRADVAEWDVPTLLNKARITKQGRITRSALLLLGRDEAAHLLSPVDAKITWILRNAQNRTESSQHFAIPFLLTTEKVFGQIRNVMIEHMPDGSLFPTAVSRYDSWVVREALHNCIAHQDYRMGGKINVVEHPDKLAFTNLGQFIPASVEWMLEHQSPPEYYRNQWLIDGMIRLRMIDQVGSGIRRMFEAQRERFFPLPDYLFDTTDQGLPSVEVTIAGNVLDIKYTRMLMQRSDLSLRQVLLLDGVQKRKPLSTEQAKALRTAKLIEGRSPNFFVSAKVATWTGDKARYIRNRGLDDAYYRKLITDYLEKYGEATRQDIDELLLSKLPDVLSQEQKTNKIRNLMQAMRKEGLIFSVGPRSKALWRFGSVELD